MKPTTGYYSLIQFCPDPSRLETANVGVLLFCPEQEFLQAIVTQSNRRLQRFFGRENFDWKRIASHKRAIQEQIESNQAIIRTLKDLEFFIANKANQFIVTEPRPMLVLDPADELRKLFKELVAPEARTLLVQDNIKAILQRRFAESGLLETKVRANILVQVPSFRKTVEIPFGYQNGRFNLVQPVRFQASEETQIISTACRYAVEGRSLYEKPDATFGDLQLVIVGMFSAKQPDNGEVVKKILTDNQVKLFSTAQIGSLISEIRKTAKDLPADK